jgi:type 1 glutamine amidotransferase
MKKILLVTSGIFHPPLFGRMALHNMLKHMKDFSFAHVSSLEKLPADLDSFSALVLHYHHKTISDTALNRLDTFVKNGGGILALHAATASFKATLPYFKILGGRFIGHGKVERFQVKKLKDGIFDGIEDFIVKDELYIHELEPNIEVYFMAKHEGKDIPVVWTYRYGKGKVCYAVPGHTTGSMYNETYQQILKRGLKWVTE